MPAKSTKSSTTTSTAKKKSASTKAAATPTKRATASTTGARKKTASTSRTTETRSTKAPAKAAEKAAPKPAVAPEIAPKKVESAPKEDTLDLLDPKAAGKSGPPRPRGRALPTIGRRKTPEPESVEVVKPEPAATPKPAAKEKDQALDLIGAGKDKAELEEETIPEAEAVADVSDAPQAEAPEAKTIHIKPPIIVRTLAEELGIKPFEIMQDLMALNIFSNINGNIDAEIAAKVCERHGFIFELEKRKQGGGVHAPVAPEVTPEEAPVVVETEKLQPRPPIITFMGHVDHGKTTLMDAVRRTRVVAGEAGGITQHIGAYSVQHEGNHFTFLDTPGHAAFTAMRARGAKVTDIVVLVVAADDGLMPQTLEAISHAKAANVSIVVAINKIDLPAANPDKVRAELQKQDLTPDTWGGDIPCVEVSALKGLGIDDLLTTIDLQAQLLELKANPDETPRATVIEAKLEPGRGPTATVIVSMGTLKPGLPFICGNQWGKIKAMLGDDGKPIKVAPPATPVSLLGFTELVNAGDELVVMESEKSARTLSEERVASARQEKLGAPQRATLENLFETMAEGQKKLLKVVLKSDVQGSLEAIKQSLSEIKSDKINLEMLHSGVGPISDTDVLLASASDAIIVGFGVKVEAAAAGSAKREGVQIKLYSIIYELIDQIKEAMAGMLDPMLRESLVGRATVKKVFSIAKGKAAGCLVTEGRILRSARARVLRGRQPIYDGGMGTLRRFNEEVKEVRNSLECGIRLGDFNEYEENDIIECYQLEKVPQTL
ncbi:MAG: translation initiation factor IF-2 [Verrucomicrobiales bacterium]